MTYSAKAVEWAMKIQEVILQAMSGRQIWLQVADVLGLSPRTVRRLRWRYEHHGYDGLFDRRRRVPSPGRAPLAEVQRILQLYRDRLSGWNVRHFYGEARHHHRVTLSYTFVKQALQAAGLVPKHRARGRHRRREPRPCFRELLHLDGSRHHWLALVPDAWQTMPARRRCGYCPTPRPDFRNTGPSAFGPGSVARASGLDQDRSPQRGCARAPAPVRAGPADSSRLTEGIDCQGAHGPRTSAASVFLASVERASVLPQARKGPVRAMSLRAGATSRVGYRSPDARPALDPVYADGEESATHERVQARLETGMLLLSRQQDRSRRTADAEEAEQGLPALREDE